MLLLACASTNLMLTVNTMCIHVLTTIKRRLIAIAFVRVVVRAGKLVCEQQVRF